MDFEGSAVSAFRLFSRHNRARAVSRALVVSAVIVDRARSSCLTLGGYTAAQPRSLSALVAIALGLFTSLDSNYLRRCGYRVNTFVMKTLSKSN